MNDFYIIPKHNKTKHDHSSEYNKISNSFSELNFRSPAIFTKKFEYYTILVIGDFFLTGDRNFLEKEAERIDYKSVLSNLKGTYYFFVIKDDSITCFNGFLGLWPIYYSEKQKIVSSSFHIFLNDSCHKSISEQYILETFLFNHAFGNKTILEEVKISDTHSILNIAADFSIHQTGIYDTKELFQHSPVRSGSAYNELVEKFILLIKDYVPDKESVISFTGGFDSRTIVSAALFSGKKFDTFSFGKSENADVRLPLEQSKQLGIEYLHIKADDKYAKQHYPVNSEELSISGGGFNGFLYPHFLSAAKQLSSKYKYLVTGYGGSELFRTVHIHGAVTSGALYQSFYLTDRKKLREELLKNGSLRFLNKELIERNIDKTIDEIIDFRNQLADLDTINKKLYIYILNESIRKIFGSWQFAQSKHLNVRSPFLDFQFLESLFATDLAGVYNKFSTDNPFRRIKGQLLYAMIIKSTNETILSQNTAKGYRPGNLLSVPGRIKLAFPYFTKRIKRNVIQENLDNLSIVSGLDYYLQCQDIKIPGNFFNPVETQKQLSGLSPYMRQSVRDSILNIYSLNTIINYE